jgi:hypothetical protein
MPIENVVAQNQSAASTDVDLEDNAEAIRGAYIPNTINLAYRVAGY